MNENSRQESFLDTLEKLGYIATVAIGAVDDTMIALKNRHNQNIGNIDINDNINLYTAHEWEREKISKAMEFANLYHGKEQNPDSSVALLTHNGVTMTANLDEHTGNTYYMVLPENYTDKDKTETPSFRNIENAKRTFAVEAGFTNNTLVSKDYQEALQNKLSSLLRKHGYEVQFGATPSEAMKISLDDDMVATLDDNFALSLKTPNTKIAGLLESVHEQATWETRNEFEFQPTLMRKIADALIRMSYSVKHSFDNLSVKLGIFKGDKVAEMDSGGKLSFEQTTPEHIRKEIEKVYQSELSQLAEKVEMLQEELAQRIGEEFATEFDTQADQSLDDEIAQEAMLEAMHEKLQQEAICRTEEEGIAEFEKQEHRNQSNPAHEDFKDTGETSSQLSRQEAVLIATLLKSGDCQALSEKHNCRYAVDTLMKKLDKEYPDLNLSTNELPTREKMQEQENSRAVTDEYGEPPFEPEP